MPRIVLALLVLLTAAPSFALADPVAATYTQRAHLAQDAAFVGRVGIAAVAGALAVIAESPQVTDHAQRVRLAAFVLREPEFVAKKLALLIAATSTVVADGETIDLALSDAQLQGLLALHWTLLANTLIAVPEG